MREIEKIQEDVRWLIEELDARFGNDRIPEAFFVCAVAARSIGAYLPEDVRNSIEAIVATQHDD